MLQRKNFDFERHVINIYADDTKNDNSSFRVIPVCLEKYLKVLNIESLESTDYIFSDHSLYSFNPGKKLIDKRYFAKYWSDKVRPALGFGMELQFYSLKDTGITNLMSDGISPVFVQKQADHSSLETTNMYTDKNLPEGFDQLRNLAKPV
jgi:integrase/recombinase XerD